MAVDEKTIADKILLCRYHEQGDLRAREQLIERYMPLVHSVARHYLTRGELLDDLVQIGAVGLIKAIDRFDSSRGTMLSTYAVPNIKGEILRHFRDRSLPVHIPRSKQELSIRLSTLTERLAAQLGRSPSTSELAQAADAEEEDVLEALAARRAYYSLSIVRGANEEESDELESLEALGRIEQGYELSDDRVLLHPGFRVLDDRERTILYLRFFEELTQSQIAHQVGLSQMQISRLISRALEKMRTELTA